MSIQVNIGLRSYKQAHAPPQRQMQPGKVCRCDKSHFKKCKGWYAFSRLGRITWHIDHDYNYDEACWGKRGRGKSNCLFKTAKILQKLYDPDHPFDPNTQIIYNLEDFFEVARAVETPGHVLMMDEGAIDMGNRASSTLFGQLFNKRQQTIRYKGIISLWALPNIQLLDLNQRRMLTGILWLWDDLRGTGEYEETVEARDGDIYIRPYPKPANWDVKYPTHPFGWPWPADEGMRPGGPGRAPIPNFKFTPIPPDDPDWIQYMKIKKENDKMLEDTLEEQVAMLSVNSKAAIRGSAYKRRDPVPVDDALMRELSEIGDKSGN